MCKVNTRTDQASKDFCVGDLNMNMCCSNTESEASERGD